MIIIHMTLMVRWAENRCKDKKKKKFQYNDIDNLYILTTRVLIKQKGDNLFIIYAIIHLSHTRN